MDNFIVATFPTAEAAEVCHYRLTELFGATHEFPISVNSRLTGSEWVVFANPGGQRDDSYQINLGS